MSRFFQMRGMHVQSHDFRATTATQLYESTSKDLKTVQTYLGHSNVNQTAQYVKKSEQEVLGAVGQLFAGRK